jgi:hypothetical protein
MPAIESAICPCEVFVHPRPIVNAAGLDRIAYRPGDYASFRHALLLARPGEQALAGWHPSEGSDLGLQLLEWWALLSDILTFYSERAASEAYLRTAVLPESVRRLVGLLGYRPRPAIGAQGMVAALLSGPSKITLPAGFPLQSKPPPGKQPQTFEVDADTTVVPPDAVPADPPPDDQLGGRSSVLAAGVPTVKVHDQLLLLEREGSHWALITVDSLTPEPDPRGKPCTRIAFSVVDGAIPASAKVGDYQLLRSTQSAHPWLVTAAASLTSTELHLDGVHRSISIGDPMLIEGERISRVRARGRAGHVTFTSARALVRPDSYAEVIWYANAAPSTPGVPPTSTDTQIVIPIPILHTQLDYTGPALLDDLLRSTVTVRFGWRGAAVLVAAPRRSMTEAVTQLTAVAPATFLVGTGLPVFLEGALGAGASATLSSSDGKIANLAYAAGTSFTLPTPLRVLFGVVPVSRGQTVPPEQLGSGDPTVANQEFTLAKIPLTYLAAPGTLRGYASTLRVYVDGVAWREVDGFYGQPPGARVFTTREDDDGKTHVRFGDGQRGARPPAGTGNIVAYYRMGGGAESPPAGTLTVPLRAWPGLKAIRNPVAVGGGGDPDSPKALRALAPRSVLAFGRAVSADDWETIAAAAPGVTRARAYATWDAVQQRSLVKVYVGDDGGALTSARNALDGAADPNRPRLVLPAQGKRVVLALTVVVAADRLAASVGAAVSAALLDPDSGLFAPGRRRLGEPIYDSEIYDACLAVPGATAVHALSFSLDGAVDAGPRHSPGEGGFFTLAADDLDVSTQQVTHGG